MGQLIGYFERLWAALGGRDIPRETVPEARLATRHLAGEVARLRAALENRDERITVMKQEYAQLEEARDRAVAISGQEQATQLFKALAGPLSNLVALSDLAQAGQAVAAKDLLTLVRSLFRELEKAGLQALGRTGETVEFDPALHQCMSGGSVQPGSPVMIEIPGFRVRDTILLKAMASAKRE